MYILHTVKTSTEESQNPKPKSTVESDSLGLTDVSQRNGTPVYSPVPAVISKSILSVCSRVSLANENNSEASNSPNASFSSNCNKLATTVTPIAPSKSVTSVPSNNRAQSTIEGCSPHLSLTCNVL